LLLCSYHPMSVVAHKRVTKESHVTRRCVAAATTKAHGSRMHLRRHMPTVCRYVHSVRAQAPTTQIRIGDRSWSSPRHCSRLVRCCGAVPRDRSSFPSHVPRVRVSPSAPIAVARPRPARHLDRVHLGRVRRRRCLRRDERLRHLPTRVRLLGQAFGVVLAYECLQLVVVDRPSPAQ